MSTRSDNESRSKARRISISGKIDLEFPNFDGLLTCMSSNLSTLGMFIESEAIEPPGTEFRFNLQVEDWSAIHGTAEVVWTRRKPAGPERPAGMGVRFLELEGESRRIVRWLVDKHVQEGGHLFDLDTVPVGASKFRGLDEVGAGHDIDKRGSHTTTRPPRARGRRILIGSILGLTIGLSTYRLWMDDRPGRGRLQPPQGDMEESEDRPRPDPVGNVAPTASSAGSATAQIASIEAISEIIQVWSSAVERRDVATLERVYSADHSGDPLGMAPGLQNSSSSDRGAGISALQVEFPSSDTARATFNRSVRLTTGIEVRRMVLDLVHVDGSWKIQQERFLD